MSATVSPLLTPSLASPPARADQAARRCERVPSSQASLGSRTTSSDRATRLTCRRCASGFVFPARRVSCTIGVFILAPYGPFRLSGPPSCSLMTKVSPDTYGKKQVQRKDFAAGCRAPATAEIQARRPTAPTAPRSPTQPTHATQPTQLTHPTHAAHARHPRFAMPATMAALPSTPALSVTAELPTTPALATVPALQATPALASVPALPITPALLTVPTLAITPALSTVPALPRTPALPAVAVEPAGPTPSSVRGSGVPGLIASGTRRPGAGRCRC